MDSTRSDHAWFAAFYPSKAPEIAVVVLAEHGGAGPTTAAPIAIRNRSKTTQRQSATARWQTDSEAQARPHRHEPSEGHDGNSRAARSRAARGRIPMPFSKTPECRNRDARASISTADDARIFGRTREQFRLAALLVRVRCSPSSASSTLYSATSVSKASLAREVYIQQVYFLVVGGILATAVSRRSTTDAFERFGYPLYVFRHRVASFSCSVLGQRHSRQLALDLHRLVQLSAERVHEIIS